MENQKEESYVRRKLKKLLFLIAVVVVVGASVFLSRGKYVSDTLKSLVVPELESMTGQRVVIGAIHVNLFPLFADAREIKVLDSSGTAVLLAKRAKGYVDLTGLLSKHLTIRRLVINEPNISADRLKIEEIVRNVTSYLEKERETALKVKLKVIEIVKGDVAFTENDPRTTANIKGLQSEVILGENPRVNGSIKELVIEKEGWPKIVCDIKTAITLKGEKIEVRRLEIGSYGSKFEGEGFYSKGQGLLKTKLALFVETVKRIFGLKQKGGGRISLKGEIRVDKEEKQPAIRQDRPGPRLKLQEEKSGLPGLKDIVVDLKLGGTFHVETLMELLEVEERIEGQVDVDGDLAGRLTDLRGKGKARMRKGNLYNVDIDSLTCNIFYEKGVMRFEKGDGVLYNGTAQANASINLPVVDSFMVDVKFHSVDSKPVFKLIGWDPGIPAGKVDGELLTSGPEFSPRGSFDYRSLSIQQRAGMKGYQPPADDFLNRVKSVKGSYSLTGDSLSLSDLVMSTSRSSARANGIIDLARTTLSLRSTMLSEDVADLALPYYAGVRGRGEFSGEISGTFDNPKLSGRAALSSAVIEGYRVESVMSAFTYQKNLLEIRETLFRAAGEEHRAKGKIFFPDAKELFELSKPVYDLTASIRNAEFGQFVRMFYQDFSAEGRLSGEFKIGGKEKDVEASGNASVEKGALYGVAFDSSHAAISYARGELSLGKGRVTRGKSVVAVEGKVGTDKKFSYRASSEKLFLKDILPDRFAIPEDAVLKARSDGHGTFDNPVIALNASLLGASFKGRNLGGGTINATIRNRDISVDVAMFDEKMRLKGKGQLNDKLPWSAELSIQPGRYEVLVSSFMKDVPEDLQFSIEGRAQMNGDRQNIAATANIDRLTLSLFGQTFTNGSDIKVAVENQKFSFGEFTVKSGAASFKFRGGMEIGKNYDITLAGSASLSPLKALSKKIGYLKGDTDFALAVKGRWEKPEITGSMNLSNAAFGLKDYPTYISSIKGSLFMEQDRVVLRGLSGKVGGGDLRLSGVLYLSGFLVQRFYVEAKLAGVTAAPSKDFYINFDGDLLYKGTPAEMGISGDIKINRAKYKEPLEWRSWIFAAKGIEKPKTEVSAFERARLNISIKGSENISIDNNVARAPVKIAGAMLVKGIVSKPVLFGRIEANEGYVYFRNNEFRIISVSVDLVDPNRIKPLMNLTAETTIQGYRIRLNLEGQMDRFNLALSSQPHLEDRDILSLLTSGQIGNQLKGIEGGVGAGEATSFLTGKIQDVVEERMRTIAGLDRFQVEPYVSSTTGTVGPRVTVSKRLIGEKLFVTYANLLGATEEQVIKIEYFLGKRVSLVGVRDEKGSLGGDVRFRFEFK